MPPLSPRKYAAPRDSGPLPKKILEPPLVQHDSPLNMRPKRGQPVTGAVASLIIQQILITRTSEFRPTSEHTRVSVVPWWPPYLYDQLDGALSPSSLLGCLAGRLLQAPFGRSRWLDGGHLAVPAADQVCPRVPVRTPADFDLHCLPSERLLSAAAEETLLSDGPTRRWVFSEHRRMASATKELSFSWWFVYINLVRTFWI